MLKLLKFDGHWLVAEVEEIPDTELGDPDCVLKYACEVSEDGALPFPLYSEDTELVAVSYTHLTLPTTPYV